MNIYILSCLTLSSIVLVNGRSCGRELINVSSASGVKIESVHTSRVEFNSPNALYTARSKMNLQFKTSKSTGLVFYAGNRKTRNMVAIFLDSGKLMFEYDCGASTGSVALSSGVYNDNQWHDVTLNLKKRHCQVILDHKEIPEFYTSCKHFNTIFLGGFSETMKYDLASKSKIIRWKKDIKGVTHRLGGCIRNFRIDGFEVPNPKYIAISPCS